ncbi:hypothetical protein vseg_019476 [Gypsophila vaccaria]
MVHYSHTIFILKTFIFLCYFCNYTYSDQRRDSYNDRLKHSQSLRCPPSGNASTSFLNNLNLLYSNFALQSSQTGFYNASVGAGSPDTVHGYFMCRGDINHHHCHECVLNATEFAGRSPCESVVGNFHSEYCSFGYSNVSLYGTYDDTPSAFAFDYVETNVSNYEKFNQTLSSTLTSVINLTAFNSSQVVGFATAEDSVTQDETIIYSMAQCTPDIAGVQCHDCLEFGYSALRRWADGAPGAVVFMDKCMLRYDNVSFYDLGEFRSNEKEGLRVSFIGVFCLVGLVLGHGYLQ